jgi:hypothetical protein
MLEGFCVTPIQVPAFNGESDEINNRQTLFEQKHARGPDICLFPLQKACETRPRSIVRVTPYVRNCHVSTVNNVQKAVM